MRLPDLPATLTILILSLVLVQLSLNQAGAQVHTNNSSTIFIEGIDIAPTSTPKPPRGSGGKLLPTTTLNQHEAEESQSVVPHPNPQEQKPPEEKKFFSLRLDQSDVDFGPIDPTNPVIRTHRFVLDPGNATGYSLFAYANHPLMKQEEVFIPDTTCDDGQCTQAVARPWEDTLTYGLGFRCDETENDTFCSPDFLNQQHYRQFADVAKQETGMQVIRSLGTNKPVNARITYKVNVAGTQEKGTYTNALVFIAAPGF